MTLPVSEIFTDVWQGEGPHTGRHCAFIRLGLCNLRCEWCDTPYTWDTDRFDVRAECPPQTVEQILARVRHPQLVILTGGEPMLHVHTPTFFDLIDALSCVVHVETNGTIAPPPWYSTMIEHTSVSPKLAPQGDPPKRRLRMNQLREWAALAHAGQAVFKVVVRDEREVADAEALFEELSVPAEARWVMPEGTDADTVLHRARKLAPVIANYRLNLTLRQHVLMYGMERCR